MTTKQIQRQTLFHKRQNLFICLFLLLATFAVFFQVKNHEFVNFDDDRYVTRNQYVHDGLSIGGIEWAFGATYESNWHPLTWLSHMLDSEIFGIDSGWHHLVNLFLHMANSLLLFLVFQRMTRNGWPSAFVAALFALHPLHVESVAWLAERKDVLSTLFWVLTMWSYLRYVESPKTQKYLLVIVFFALGLMAKPMLVTLPFVLLLLDYWPLGRMVWGRNQEGGNKSPRTSALSLVREKIPLFALAAVSCIVTYGVQQSGGAVSSFSAIPLDLRLTNALVSYVTYLVKMFWPYNLAVIYPYHGNMPTWHVVGASLLLVLIFFLVFRARRRYPYLMVGWLWFVGTLVPVSGLVQVGSQAMADRYTYIPLTGVFIMIAWGAPDLLAHWRSRNVGLAVAAVTTVFIFMATTWLHIGYWANSVTLFEHAIRMTTDNYNAHYNLGVALEDRGNLEEAMENYSKALQIRPKYMQAHNNLGHVLATLGNTQQAIEHFSKALDINADYADPHYNMANALMTQGKIQEALRHYQEALRIKPDYAKAHDNLGNALIRQGDIVKAMIHYSKALEIMPDFSDAHINLGNALASQGNTQQAISHYAKALRINPYIPQAHYNMGSALMGQGDIKRAIKHYREAVRIDPGYAKAHYALANALMKQGRIAEAITHYSNALQIHPNFDRVHNGLGAALARQGRFEAAIDHFQKALRIRPDNATAQNNLAKALAAEKKKVN